MLKLYHHEINMVKFQLILRQFARTTATAQNTKIKPRIPKHQRNSRSAATAQAKLENAKMRIKNMKSFFSCFIPFSFLLISAATPLLLSSIAMPSQRILVYTKYLDLLAKLELTEYLLQWDLIWNRSQQRTLRIRAETIGCST